MANSFVQAAWLVNRITSTKIVTNMNQSCWKSRFLLVGLTLCLSGCSGPRALSPNGPPKGEAVVFGAIEPASNRKFISNWWDQVLTADIVDIRTSKILFSHPLGRKSNSFYWHLAPGEYAVLAIAVLKSVGNSTGRRAKGFWA